MGAIRKEKTVSNFGFTLIEVVLVLAIGGLIFLLSFLAFSQVSANRRDAQRRQDARRIIAELKNYYADKGSYPDNSLNIGGNICIGPADPESFHLFIQEYLCQDGLFRGPNNQGYILNAITTNSSLNRIRYATGYDCSGVKPDSMKVEIILEKGMFCVDSSY